MNKGRTIDRMNDVMMPPAPPSAGAISPKESRTLVSQLKRSQVNRDYEKAFRETTGLPIALRPLEAFDLPHHGDPKESPFCALMAQSNRTCAASLAKPTGGEFTTGDMLRVSLSISGLAVLAIIFGGGAIMRLWGMM